MDIRDEKCRVYELLKLLIEERREISKQYYDLKEYLIHLENDTVSQGCIEKYPVDKKS